MRWVCAQLVGCLRLLGTPWIVALQAPLSMAFSKKENLSGLPLPTSGS